MIFVTRKRKQLIFFNHLHDHDLHIYHVKKGVMCETNTVSYGGSYL